MENINESKSTTKGVNPTPPIVEKKRRKTLDEYLGINGFLIIAIIGAVLGGIFAIGNFFGTAAVYYLIKRRKELSNNQKYIGWFLVILWVLLLGLIPQLIKQQ